jgi:hypothetical protein
MNSPDKNFPDMETKFLPLVCEPPFVMALTPAGNDEMAQISFIWVNPHYDQSLFFNVGSST